MATATYYAKAKVRIGKLAPTVSHNDIYIGVDYGAGDPTKQTIHRTLLWFDLASPADQGELVAGAVIASAVIKGSVTNTNGTPITCRAERLTRDYYGYDHTTWNNYDTALAWTTPGGDKDSTGSATFPMPTLGDDKTIADITALAIDAVDNRAGDLRVVLRADDESLYTTETHWTNLAYDDNPSTAGQVTTAQAMGDALTARLVAAGLKFEVL